MRLLVCVLSFAVGVGFTLAQAPVAPKPGTKDDKDKPKEKPKGDKPAKLPPSPLDKVEGYKRQIIEGFTVMLSAEAGEGEIKGAELKPLDALALEFQTMKKVMPAKQIELLQNVTVWVEWDEYQAMSNGREGRALATYYGGSQLAMLNDKKNPLKAKCVTIHSLKMLAEQHQPKVEEQSLVILHEMAHAVHDQLLGFDHGGIKAAYRQALERKLYDKAQYVSTNDREFFAELSCSYYDQLQHYPKTRDDLKKHDPVSYQVLESIWGSGRKASKVPAVVAKPKSLAELDGSDKFDMKLTLGDLKLGSSIYGPEFKVEDAKGEVVILSNFGGDELLILEKLSRIHEELSPYGAKVLVAYSFVSDPEAVKKKLEERAVAYTGFEKALFPLKDGQSRSEKPGHTVIFDAEGKCVFRGSGYEALPHARAALGQKLIAKAIKGEIPKSLVPITDAMTRGSTAPLEQIPKIAAFVTSGDPEVATSAKQLAAALLEPAQILLAEAQSQAKSDPLSAFLIAEKIPHIYKGTSVAAKAAGLSDQLKLNPAVALELKARALFEPIRKLDAALMAQPGSFSPLENTFQKSNEQAIQQLIAQNALLKKKYPMARVTPDAAKIVSKYSLVD